MSWLDAYRSKVTTPENAVKLVKSGDRVTLSANAGVPRALMEALAERSPELADVEIAELLTLGDAPFDRPEHRRAFRANCLFVGANLRDAVEEGRADYTPIFLSEIPRLFEKRLPIDVAFVQVAPPDEHGFCSLGVSVDVIKPAAEGAKAIVAEVNRRCPRTLGDSFIHVSRFAAIVEVDRELPELPPERGDDVARRIGERAASLVEDGDTLQIGIGCIPDAVLASLGGRRDLGIHTEMFSDGVMALVESGVITGERKPLHRGKLVSSFVMGSAALYRWTHDNSMIRDAPVPLYERPLRHRAARPLRRDQLGDGDRSHGSGRRRRDRTADLLRDRRPGRLHARRAASRARSSGDRAPVDREERCRLEDRPRAATRRDGRHEPRRRPLRRHRARDRRPLGQDAP